MLGGNLAIDWYPIRGRGVVALLVTSFYRNSIELQPDGASWPECWVIHIIVLMKWSFLLIYACIIMNLCEFGTESFAKESEKHIKTDTTILTVAYTVAYTGFPYKNWILTKDYFKCLVKSSTPWEKENLRMAGILILSLKGRYYPSNWCEISYMIVFLDKWIFQEIWNTGQYNKCVSCHCDSRKCQRKGLHKFHTWYLHLLVFKTLLHQTVIYFLTVILVLRIYHTSEQCLSCVLIG